MTDFLRTIIADTTDHLGDATGTATAEDTMVDVVAGIAAGMVVGMTDATDVEIAVTDVGTTGAMTIGLGDND